jgi:hypothetical protein
MREYNNTIDETIVNALYDKDKDKIGFRELKKTIEKRLNMNKRELSFDVFN